MAGVHPLHEGGEDPDRDRRSVRTRRPRQVDDGGRVAVEMEPTVAVSWASRRRCVAPWGGVAKLRRLLSAKAIYAAVAILFDVSDLNRNRLCRCVNQRNISLLHE